MNFASIRRKLRNLLWPARTNDDPHRLGSRGERAAAGFLKRKRHRIIARNYRSPLGEIDLITADGDTIVFVEVKTRTNEQAEDSINAARPPQWARIERAARYFLQQRRGGERPCRFDLVVIIWPPRGAPRIEHYENVHQSRRQ